MKKIAIIGVGLIGGSLGMALREKKYHVLGVGRNEKELLLAQKLGAIDIYTTDIKTGVKDADIVFISTPVDVIVPMLKRILPFTKKGCTISDVGSIKYEIVKEVEKMGIRNFVPAHPLSGSEKTGVKYASKDLFKNATVVLTPLGITFKKAITAIKKIWNEIGAKTILLDAKKHDELVSITSHLPHIISVALLDFVPKNGIMKNLVAGSFRDLTRISDSDPHNWAMITLYNKKNIEKAIKEFINKLRKIRNLLSDKRKVENVFISAKNKRKILIRK